MRIDSHPEAFLNRVESEFVASGHDVMDEAARRSGSSTIAASGRVEQLGDEDVRVVFTAPFAKARERGAFIRPRRGRGGRNGRAAALRFADGSFRMFARLRKHPYLGPAGGLWTALLVARLRAIGAGARRAGQ